MLWPTVICSLILLASTGVRAWTLRTNDDPCMICNEDDDGFSCVYGNCPLGNSCVDAVAEPGECCAVCPNGPNCLLDGEKIPVGELITRQTDDMMGKKCEKICHCPYLTMYWYSIDEDSKAVEAKCELACGPLEAPKSSNPLNPNSNPK